MFSSGFALLLTLLSFQVLPLSGFLHPSPHLQLIPSLVLAWSAFSEPFFPFFWNLDILPAFRFVCLYDWSPSFDLVWKLLSKVNFTSYSKQTGNWVQICQYPWALQCNLATTTLRHTGQCPSAPQQTTDFPIGKSAGMAVCHKKGIQRLSLSNNGMVSALCSSPPIQTHPAMYARSSSRKLFQCSWFLELLVLVLCKDFVKCGQ